MEVTYYRHPKYKEYFGGSNGTILSVSKRGVRFLNPLEHKGYLRQSLSRKYKNKNNGRLVVKVHRFILECFEGCSLLEVNHKNGNRSDNRIENLEYCNRQQNVALIHQGKKRFVSKCFGKYRARIRLYGKTIYSSGLVDSEKEAYEFAYNEYYKHFGIEPWSK
jgi:hypothetical protein